ncbi:isoprenylcysteine carboxylmethyltransferase family protein [Clostridium estertheticum]|uniref:methyltransferase family protein n=1 Tax=Clostridium estertheticum TaxID=238834 RepID=UPI001C7CB170|nr:isoprenylcysteine carboxylmethyltransferase family protein [Clostridium estertheticum]MBX4260829.1 isoprenylcysteine carboxylmethyltransferase family protein [Clostridium estertheticum]WLC71512.1 isoprenylcysteine carboxylmethyltransferase family protein [Clostridium estertheticum]
METLQSHFHNWFGVLFFTVIYSVVFLFLPFYKKMDKKPAGTYLAFVIAFAIEMHGIPFSMYLISWIIGKNLPEGILWGHTLVSSIGFTGMYINMGCSVIAMCLIVNGWHNIYKNYWSKETGTGSLVKKGVYKYIRHPQYTGLLLLSFGMLAEWATVPMLILYPVMINMYIRLARKEEKDMIAEFGEEYREYMKETKMFIPLIL